MFKVRERHKFSLELNEHSLAATKTTTKWRKRNSCYFCGGPYHFYRSKCLAKNAVCHISGKRGHYVKACQSKLASSGVAKANQEEPDKKAID